MVKDKVAEPEWKYLHVNEQWQQMKNIMMETAQVTCGLPKGRCRHKEAWWWNEEVAEAVKEKEEQERGIKLMEHAMKVVQWIFEQRISAAD